MVNLQKTKAKLDKTPVIPICQLPIPLKFPDGKAIKVSAAKLKDLKHFHDYLEHAGRKWIKEVVLQQATANDRPQ